MSGAVADNKQHINNLIVREVDKKLTCGICLALPHEDIVEMLCPCRALFCFSCVVQYVAHLDDHTTASCPTCRQGTGAVASSPFLGQIAKILVMDRGDGDDNMDNDDADNENGSIQGCDERQLALTLKHFNLAATGVLKSAYPSLFPVHHRECPSLITATQMKVFERYSKVTSAYSQVERISGSELIQSILGLRSGNHGNNEDDDDEADEEDDEEVRDESDDDHEHVSLATANSRWRQEVVDAISETRLWRQQQQARDREEQPRPAPFSRTERYAAVNLCFRNRRAVWVVSSHSHEMQARRAITLAPPLYTSSFVIDMNSGTVSRCEVVFQSRPVQIFLRMQVDHFLSGTFENVDGMNHLVADIAEMWDISSS